MITRTTLLAAGPLVATVCLYGLLGEVLPAESLALTYTSNFLFVAVEVVVLVLCCVAYVRSRPSQEAWVWLWIGLWVGLNLFADSVWAYYEAIQRVEVPFPGIADVGYLASYVIAFAGVVYVAHTHYGRLRALETAVDALIFGLGVVALCWPFVLERLLQVTASPAEFWVSLAYPVGDLLVITAIGALLLSAWGAGRRWPRRYLRVFCLAIFFQLVADLGYFALVTTGSEYRPGSYLDTLWLLAIAVAGIAALLGLNEAQRCATSSEAERAPGQPLPSARPLSKVEFVRALLPYAALPMWVIAIATHLRENEHQPGYETYVFFTISVLLATLIFARQHLAISNNNRLNRQLARAQAHLAAEVDELASLNRRLTTLNHHLQRLQHLRTTPEIAAEALELACSWEGAPGGWLELVDSHGRPHLAAVWGNVDKERVHKLEQAKGDPHSLRAIDLDAGGQRLGTIYLLRPEDETDVASQTPDMLPAILPHVAGALDNARRYEEALSLAEKDPLTGLLNYRGLHKHLAGELQRAQETGTELSVIMADLDDFKLLNDTYGHGAGDHVLKQVADAIRAVLRHSDLAARIGGDELLLVLPNTDAQGARALAERLLETIAARPYFSPHGDAVAVRISLGTATYPHDALSLDSLIHMADVNMYVSKQQSRNADMPRQEWRHVLGATMNLGDVYALRDETNAAEPEGEVARPKRRARPAAL